MRKTTLVAVGMLVGTLGLASAQPPIHTPDENLWVNETGDDMTGDLNMGTNAVILDGRELRTDPAGDLAYGNAPVCLVGGICDTGGDITAVTTGFGLTGGGSQGNVTLTVDSNLIQRRIGNSCESGSAIKEIKADGSVICEPTTGHGFYMIAKSSRSDQGGVAVDLPPNCQQGFCDVRLLSTNSEGPHVLTPVTIRQDPDTRKWASWQGHRDLHDGTHNFNGVNGQDQSRIARDPQDYCRLYDDATQELGIVEQSPTMWTLHDQHPSVGCELWVR